MPAKEEFDDKEEAESGSASSRVEAPAQASQPAASDNERPHEPEIPDPN